MSVAGISTPRGSATATALAVPIGLAAACWVLAAGRMRGMDMGAATRLGSLVSFLVLWAVMMAAMMLPGAVPAVLRTTRARGLRALPVFLTSYLAVWVAVGLAVYALYRPHGELLTGAVVIAAGAYELTPLHRACRRRCGQGVHSGFAFGLQCLGASAGVMAMLLALGLMSLAWMSVTTTLICAQKLLPAKDTVDVALAVALVALGALILLAPTAVPGVMAPA